MRNPDMVGSIVLAAAFSACASTSPPASAPACGFLQSNPRTGAMAVRAIVGVGGAPDGPDASSAARRQAMLEIVEQIRVRIAGDTTLRARVSGTAESWDVDERIRTRDRGR